MKPLIIFLLTFSTIASSQNEILFTTANNAYNTGDYEKSIKIYHTIINKNYYSAELYFNLANAYYKTNDIPNSIYYYEKALKLDSNDVDIIHNLNIVNKLKIDVIDQFPKSFYEIFANSLIILPMRYNAYLTVGLSLFFFIFFVCYYFQVQLHKKRIYFRVSLVCLALSAFMFIITNMQYKKSLVRHGIIFQNAQLKNEPNFKSNEILQLNEGTKVKIIERLDEWAKIRLDNGVEGWLISTNFKVI